MDLVALLSGSSLFEMLSNAELEAVSALLEPRAFSVGSVIFSEGAPGDGLYVVAAGEVEIRREGRTAPLAVLGPGECFGEMSLVDHEYRSASVRALGDVELLHLSPERLAQFRKSQKDGFSFLVLNIARLLSTRLRETNAQLARR